MGNDDKNVRLVAVVWKRAGGGGLRSKLSDHCSGPYAHQEEKQTSERVRSDRKCGALLHDKTPFLAQTVIATAIRIMQENENLSFLEERVQSKPR